MTEPAPEHLLRELAPQVLGAILRRYRDFAAAEDAVQEALIAAAIQWPNDGLPDNPRAWLIHVASRRMTDAIRSDAARRQREADAGLRSGYVFQDSDSSEDDTLILMYMCCHSALTDSSAIALTLRAVGGLTTAQIARAFLVPEATMAQRISRAKQTVRESGVPFSMPEPDARQRRLQAVLHVLYLIFSEGYTASEGEHLQRPDLAAEAIRLTRLVHARRPEESEVAGLLALMLLTDARRLARTGPLGEPIPLDKQDRRLWDRVKIAEGVELIGGPVGPYQIQAAIAALHDEAPSAAETDWPQILALYSVLMSIADNPMVALNRAVAAAMVQGPEEGMRLIAELDGSLRDHHRLHAVRGHLLEMAKDFGGAIDEYLAAAARTASVPERNYLLEQAARLRSLD
jgi:RNA polymerase sigma factor (sigma-70 family)